VYTATEKVIATMGKQRTC